MVMLAGQVLGLPVFCVLKSQDIKINSTQLKAKGSSSDLSVALDVFLSSLMCEIKGMSHGRGFI